MLKLNVGLSRKVGEANYGSRGASVNLEVEVDSGLTRAPEKLREQIRYLFRLAEESVESELNGNGKQATNGHSGNGQSANGRSNSRSTNGRSATQSQVRALFAIANRQKIDLAALLQERHQVHQADQLSLTEASQLIDELNAANHGAGR